MHKIDIELFPSRQFIILVLTVFLSILLVIASLPISLFIKLFLVTAVIGYCFSILTTYGFLSHKKSITLLSFADKEWKIVDSSGVYSANLCGSSTVTRFCSVLRFQVGGQSVKRSCLVFRDSVVEGLYRKLIVCLLS